MKSWKLKLIRRAVTNITLGCIAITSLYLNMLAKHSYLFANLRPFVEKLASWCNLSLFRLQYSTNSGWQLATNLFQICTMLYLNNAQHYPFSSSSAYFKYLMKKWLFIRISFHLSHRLTFQVFVINTCAKISELTGAQLQSGISLYPN